MTDHENRRRLEDRLAELEDQLGYHRHAIGEIGAEIRSIGDELYPPEPRRWVPTVLKGGAAAAALWVATKAKSKVGYVAGAGALAGAAAILALTNPFGGDEVIPGEVPNVIGTPTQRPTAGVEPSAPLETPAPAVPPVGTEPTPVPATLVEVPLPPDGSPEASPTQEPSEPPVEPPPEPSASPSPEPTPGPPEPTQQPPEPTATVTPEPPETPSPSPTPSPTATPTKPPDGGSYLACVEADLALLDLELCLLELGSSS